MRRSLFFVPFAIASLFGQPLWAAPVSSVSQYGVTWTFDKEYESGQFATGDYWVVGPVTVTSVSPTASATRNGSCVNPLGGHQGYDDRGGEFQTDEQITYPHTLDPDQSLVSSVSKPEGAETQNAGNMVSQAVLTVVSAPQPDGTLRPAYAGTYKQYFNVSQIQWALLPKLPVPGSAGNASQLVEEADRPRMDHLSSWTIQHSCAEENWNNGPGAHACYGREVSAYVSEAALFVLLDTPQRDELALSMIQHGIDNSGVLKAGGNWAPNGGHHSGRKWPIVFAATMLDDCDMKQVGTDYDDSDFGEDGQTYYGVDGKALFGWDCGGGQGSYFENGCSGGGAKDCRDPAGLVDACPDYRNCCTSGYWIGQMLSTMILGAKAVWNHDPYFDYVDRWMTGDVDDADGSDAFSEEMWNTYRDNLPSATVSPICGSTGGTGGTSSGGASSGGSAGVATGGNGGSTGGSVGTGGTKNAADGSDDDGGCGCRTPSSSSSTSALWLAGLAVAIAGLRRKLRATSSD
jgi:MYXO-CTERM domain-containing protein